MNNSIDMFENYDNMNPDYIPDNRPKCHCHCGLKLMTGETTTHSFEIPFDVEKDVKDYQIIYRYNLNEILIKNKNEIEVISYDDETHKSIISCTISADESKLFNSLTLDCFAQVKFINLDDTISYSVIYKVKISDAIDVKEV